MSCEKVRELLSLALDGGVSSGKKEMLRAHIANLRRKIEPPDGPRIIRTESGVGYRFAA